MMKLKNNNKSILFVSSLWDRWGGSEELWSQTALKLVAQGYDVSASVHGFSPVQNRVEDLIRGGIDVWPRASQFSLGMRVRQKLTFRQDGIMGAEVRKVIDKKSPSLIVFSDGGIIPLIEFLELCVAKRVPFVTIGNANTENWWPEDELAERYRKILPAALRCFFVSRANLRLFEKQIGCELANAEVIRNPFGVNFHASPPWPMSTEAEVLFACVGRLHPISKGQDILLEALATSVWANRKWRLTLYGDGPMKNSLQRLVQRLGLNDRVFFAGHVAAMEDIWALNQILVMPSRCEGLPIVMVEAMLCGRAVIATDVAGHSEIVEDGITGFLAEAPTVPSMLKALDRFWVRRTESEHMGRMAQERIRRIIPQDPVAIFTDKLKELSDAFQGKV